MGFGGIQGFPVVKVTLNAPAFIIKGGGGKVTKTVTTTNPTFTLSVS